MWSHSRARTHARTHEHAPGGVGLGRQRGRAVAVVAVHLVGRDAPDVLDVAHTRGGRAGGQGGSRKMFEQTNKKQTTHTLSTTKRTTGE